MACIGLYLQGPQAYFHLYHYCLMKTYSFKTAISNKSSSFRAIDITQNSAVFVLKWLEQK